MQQILRRQKKLNARKSVDLNQNSLKPKKVEDKKVNIKRSDL